MIPRKQRMAAEMGLAFLEARYPGCLEKFDLETLDMSNPNCCALAQASGRRYGAAIDELDLSAAEQKANGLIADVLLTRKGVKLQYSRLTTAYKELILERRAA